MGCGFLGTNIHPGQVHRFVETDILSSRQLTHEGLMHAWVLTEPYLTTGMVEWYRVLYAWILYYCLFPDTILHSTYIIHFYTVSTCFEWMTSYD
jgi:hypothetical protein